MELVSDFNSESNAVNTEEAFDFVSFFAEILKIVFIAEDKRVIEELELVQKRWDVHH